jgi:putative ABC transport system ATP-binding protein
MDILNDINREGTTIILVTHDMKVAARADRILFIQDGIIHDQLEIGKYPGQEEALPGREKQVWTWLEQKGF